MRRTPGSILGTATVALCGAVMAGSVQPALAQIPDEFTNLKVLPSDTEKRQLIGTMRSFTSALGVRCNHCHVGENPDSLEGYDFASDERETKRTARVMLKMVQEINGSFLPTTERENLTTVTCVTCHRGVTKPEQLQGLLLATLEAEGVEAAVARYRELREEHYGSGAYDFSPNALDTLTEALGAGRQDRESAMAINQLNLEFNPDAAYTLYLHARLLLLGGDREGAIATLERAIAANPDVGWLKGQLAELQKPPAPDDGG